MRDSILNSDRDWPTTGNRAKIDRLEIRWPQPSAKVETFTDLPIDRYIIIVEGIGIK